MRCSQPVQPRPASRRSRSAAAILVMVDRLLKVTHFAATNDTTSAEDIARLSFDNVIRLRGCPLEIVSDRDERFTFYAGCGRSLGHKTDAH